MQQLNTSRNIPGMAVLSATLCIVGGSIVALVAWDELWLIVGVLFGVVVALYLLLTETSHLRKIEIKEIDFNHKKQQLPPPAPPVIDVIPTPKPPQLPPAPSLIQTAENTWKRVEPNEDERITELAEAILLRCLDRNPSQEHIKERIQMRSDGLLRSNSDITSALQKLASLGWVGKSGGSRTSSWLWCRRQGGNELIDYDKKPSPTLR